MVPKNLIAGQQWRNKHREQIYGHEERGGEGEIDVWKEKHGNLHSQIQNRWPTGICSMAQETQIGALYQPRRVVWGRRREGRSKGRRYMYTYG